MIGRVRWAAMAAQRTDDDRAAEVVVWRRFALTEPEDGRTAAVRSNLIDEARTLAAGAGGPSANGEPPLCHDASGAPFLAGDERTVSVSHSSETTSGAVAWMAVGVAAGRIGVDLERARPAPRALELARRWFPTVEQELLANTAAATTPQRWSEGATGLFWRLWTRKEAVAKALRIPLPEALELPVPEDARLDGLTLRTWLLGDPGSVGPGATLSTASEHPPLLSPSQPTIDTTRLRLRPVRIEDAAFIDRLDSDPRVRRYADQPAPTAGHGERTVARWLDGAGQHPGLGYWVAEDSSRGSPVGWFHLRPPRGSEPRNKGDRSLGYRLTPGAWGRGLATEGARALVRYGLDQLNAPRVTATALADNLASIAVMRRAGMHYVSTWDYTARDGQARPAVLFAANEAASLAR